MNEPIYSLPIFDADNASAAMGITLEELDETTGSITFVQRAEAWHTGIDGNISTASLGPLIDTTLGSAAYLAAASDGTQVMSSLTASFSANPLLGETIRGRATGVQVDTRSDTIITSGLLDGQAGPLAIAHCRAMPVHRAQSAARLDDVTSPSTATETQVDDGLVGRTRLELFASRHAISAPFPAALNLDVTRVTDTDVGGIWTPATWMLNPLGSVHGGVVFATAMEVSQLTAELVRDGSDAMSLAEISVDLLGSPRSEEVVTWHGSLVRSGRRLVNVAVTLAGSSGRDHAHARCSVIRHRRHR